MVEPVIEDPAMDVLEQILATGCVRTSDGEAIPLHSHIAPESGRFIQQIIREIGATTTLEIGLGYGISTLFICREIGNLPGARHYAIDPYQFQREEWAGVGLKNIRDAGYGDLVDFRPHYSHIALPQLEREGVKVDFALVDGCHTFDYTLVDLFLVDRILRVSGVMVVDDVEWPSVRKAVRYFVTNRGYRVQCCWGGASRPRHPVLKRLIRAAGERWEFMRRLLRPELLVSDQMLGLEPDCRCVALVKQEEQDRRGPFDHQPF